MLTFLAIFPIKTKSAAVTMEKFAKNCYRKNKNLFAPQKRIFWPKKDFFFLSVVYINV